MSHSSLSHIITFGPTGTYTTAGIGNTTGIISGRHTAANSGASAASVAGSVGGGSAGTRSRNVSHSNTYNPYSSYPSHLGNNHNYGNYSQNNSNINQNNNNNSNINYNYSSNNYNTTNTVVHAHVSTLNTVHSQSTQTAVSEMDSNVANIANNASNSKLPPLKPPSPASIASNNDQCDTQQVNLNLQHTTSIRSNTTQTTQTRTRTQTPTFLNLPSPVIGSPSKLATNVSNVMGQSPETIANTPNMSNMTSSNIYSSAQSTESPELKDKIINTRHSTPNSRVRSNSHSKTATAVAIPAHNEKMTKLDSIESNSVTPHNYTRAGSGGSGSSARSLTISPKWVKTDTMRNIPSSAPNTTALTGQIHRHHSVGSTANFKGGRTANLRAKSVGSRVSASGSASTSASAHVLEHEHVYGGSKTPNYKRSYSTASSYNNNYNRYNRYNINYNQYPNSNKQKMLMQMNQPSAYDFHLQKHLSSKLSTVSGVFQFEKEENKIMFLKTIESKRRAMLMRMEYGQQQQTQQTQGSLVAHPNTSANNSEEIGTIQINTNTIIESPDKSEQIGSVGSIGSKKVRFMDYLSSKKGRTGKSGKSGRINRKSMGSRPERAGKSKSYLDIATRSANLLILSMISSILLFLCYIYSNLFYNCYLIFDSILISLSIYLTFAFSYKYYKIICICHYCLDFLYIRCIFDICCIFKCPVFCKQIGSYVLSWFCAKNEENVINFSEDITKDIEIITNNPSGANTPRISETNQIPNQTTVLSNTNTNTSISGHVTANHTQEEQPTAGTTATETKAPNPVLATSHDAEIIPTTSVRDRAVSDPSKLADHDQTTTTTQEPSIVETSTHLEINISHNGEVNDVADYVRNLEMLETLELDSHPPHSASITTATTTTRTAPPSLPAAHHLQEVSLETNKSMTTYTATVGAPKLSSITGISSHSSNLTNATLTIINSAQTSTGGLTHSSDGYDTNTNSPAAATSTATGGGGAGGLDMTLFNVSGNTVGTIGTTETNGSIALTSDEEEDVGTINMSDILNKHGLDSDFEAQCANVVYESGAEQPEQLRC